MDALDVRTEYACARLFSRASDLNVFEQPGEKVQEGRVLDPSTIHEHGHGFLVFDDDFNPAVFPAALLRVVAGDGGSCS
jgi:hypothetical protein